MACPSCGKQATEYDEHKWTCLHCGNKFVFVPPSSPETHNYVQNTVNVVGQPTYELDVQNSKPAKPIIKTRYEHSPQQFYDIPPFGGLLDEYNKEKKQVERSKAFLVFWLFCGVLFGIMAISGIANKSLLLFLCFIPALGSLFFAFLYFLGSRDYKLVETKLSMEKSEQTRLNMEAQKKEKITVGYQPVCPFCMADVVNPSSGLTHCLKCGKQFHYSNECSYPVKFK